MKRCVLAVLVLASACGYGSNSGPITLGAVYPLHGGQGPGGTDEYRGTQLAVEYANAHGGVHGRSVQLRFEEANDYDAAPRAVRTLAASGVPVVIGTHGSSISAPAAETATKEGLVFWETGAVGMLPMVAASGDRVFRFVPTGESLGRAAVSFARDVLLPKMHRGPSSLRWGVAYVDDPYGRSVGDGAIAEVERAGLTIAGTFPYSFADPKGEAVRVARLIAAAHIDLLFVSAYMEDGVELRREMVRRHIPLVASVGTSSSYCMEEFGKELGHASLGLFASDKPDGQAIDASRLAADAAAQLRWARTTFESRYHRAMPAGALTGFAGTIALIRTVLANATDLTPDAIAASARAARIPLGALPNGSGLEFSGSENLRATSVIWEWVAPGVRAVVWPPSFATHQVIPMSI